MQLFHTLSWVAWLAAAATAVALTPHPLYLALALLATVLNVAACLPRAEAGARGQPFGLLLRAGAILWVGYLLFAIITASTLRGQTVLLRLPELVLPALLGGLRLGGAITLEALALGATRGLQIWTLLAIFGAFNTLVDHYRLLRHTPRALFHVGLVVTIAVAFVPGVIRAIGEIREAQRMRGHRFRGVRSALPLVAPLLSGSLEKSVQLAEALESRGYGRLRSQPPPWLTVLALGGVVLLGSGVFAVLYFGWSLPGLHGLAALTAGVLALAATVRRLGTLTIRTVYQRERWHVRDVLVIAGAGLSLALVVLVRSRGVPLAYVPYPVATLPPFHPAAGTALATLALPGVLALIHRLSP